ncbi:MULTISPECIES: hypothetical protein [unclassified Rhodococcus (in: high G+C Gram-positive bacteria)]|jgi:hypothetical protein|uniref:hypothetical protein n=1 Tax=unclassified Rhodococcus (in: high G+C Gram-positive bacteria) TaxID=192944 RepID=UPI0006F264C5|nr:MULTISPECIES: hypothetical protein [unclassified Rhodococcus (in: high G+C Gram-positive bacteria)]KQU28253.1 hypothetical protein ASG69_09490 [Rhodococcus sp. Leaf225]KQU46362.1 hypothetical protein ASH03_06525 [Rhodococcus sp. Leaf258]
MTMTSDTVRGVLDAPDGTLLVMRDGELTMTDDDSGAVLVTTKAALVEQLGDDRSPERLETAATALNDMVDKLGA